MLLANGLVLLDWEKSRKRYALLNAVTVMANERTRTHISRPTIII